MMIKKISGECCTRNRPLHAVLVHLHVDAWPVSTQDQSKEFSLSFACARVWKSTGGTKHAVLAQYKLRWPPPIIRFSQDTCIRSGGITGSSRVTGKPEVSQGNGCRPTTSNRVPFTTDSWTRPQVNPTP